MAIKKPKEQVNFLGNTKVENLTVEEKKQTETQSVETPDVETSLPVESVPSNVPSKNQKGKGKEMGRPRKLLIEGSKEKRISVDVPETLLKELKKRMRKEKKSMKELLITPAIREYLTPKTEG